MTPGYQTALKRIQKAKKSGATHLDLEGLGLTDLPPEIGGLTNLTQLAFWNNQVSDLQPIAGLENLTTLFFGNNQISNLQPIAGLEKLTGLVFSNNQISDLQPIADLTNLNQLYSQNNQISDLQPIAGLTNLTRLYFWNNQVSNLRPIAGLKNLTTLFFWNNQVSDLQPIADLTNLNQLSFSNNQISDLQPIAGLKKLETLAFPNNPITHLPSWILDLNLPIRDNYVDGRITLERISVGNNPFTEPPTEIVRQGNEAIAHYYQHPRERLGELKIILVGEGAAGKTSVLKRLLNNDFDPHEDQTHGIQIRHEDLSRFGVPTTGRFWDFGGQEIMHATHKFFLSERSVYVVVLNSRKDDNPDYWLRHIESYGGGGAAVALVVFNQMDQNPAYDLDRRALVAKYPFIRGFYPVSAQTGEGMEAFRAALLAQVTAHPLAESKFPTKWIAIKKALEAKDRDYIGYDHFRDICVGEQVDREQDQEFLLRALNDLGVALHFERLRGFNTQVLNPLWLTNAVYRIINSSLLATQRGVLHLTEVGTMLRDPRYGHERFDFPPEKWLFIVRIMEQFELCFESAREAEYIVPERLPAAGEANVPLDVRAGQRSLRLEVRFPEFMPTSIFPRLMVRTNHLIRDTMRWRTAMQLEERAQFGAQARIMADRDDRRLSIEVCGQHPRGFLSVLRRELEAIRSSFAELNMEEWVPIEGKVSVKYDTLLAHEKRNRADYFCPELERDFSVATLLDGIEEKAMRSPEGQMPVNAFVSYAHADEEEFQALKLFKKQVYVEQRLGNVNLWDDGAILPGENWSNAIWQRFEQADLVICLLSPAFIASDFCYEKELQAALEAHKKGEKTIFPVRLIDCGADQLPIGEIQGSPTQWINPGRAGEPNHEQWAEMRKAFAAVVQAVKKKKLARQSR
jgi:internalin A